MDGLQEFAQLIVALDAIAVAAVIVVGIAIAPLAVLVRRARWWRRRLKWATVSSRDA